MERKDSDFMIKQIRDIIGREKSYWMIALLAVMIVGSFLEMTGISLLMSVCSLLIDPDWLTGSGWFAGLCRNLGLGPGVESIKTLIIFLIFFYLFKAFYLILENYAIEWFVRACRQAVSGELLNGVLHDSYENIVTVGAIDIVRLLDHDVFQLTNYMVHMLRAAMELIVVLSLSLFLLAMNPVMTVFVGIGLAVLLLLIMRLMRPSSYRAGMTSRSMNRERLKWLNQTVHGFKDVKIGRKEDFFAERYNAAEKRYSKAVCISHMWTRTPALCFEAVMAGCVLTYMLFLLLSGSDPKVFFPSLSALALAVVRLLPACSRISGDISQMSYGRSSVEVIHGALLHARELHAEMSAGEGQGMPLRIGIEAADITFRYASRQEPVLQSANIEIPVGTSVGIVGPSGAGKTTLLDILLGLLVPEKGQVLVDGLPIDQCRESYLSGTAYVPQDTFLLDDAIRDNVALGEDSEEIDDRRVWEALEKAALADKVRTLPHGLDTQIGERGIRLSGGERQRLGLARAIYRNSALIVFDEATSALDLKTESAVLDSINRLKGQKTLIIVSHRMSAIAGCDRIYRVENGTVYREK